MLENDFVSQERIERAYRRVNYHDFFSLGKNDDKIDANFLPCGWLRMNELCAKLLIHDYSSAVE